MDRQSFGQRKDYFTLQKIQVPFRMAIVNIELMHECSLKHSSKETARMKYDKETKKKLEESSESLSS